MSSVSHVREAIDEGEAKLRGQPVWHGVSVEFSMMETEGVHPDVDMNINGGGFLAPDDDIFSPTNVVVAKESLELEKLQHRLSVRDLATQFESGLAAAQAAAAKITEEKVNTFLASVIVASDLVSA